MASSYRTVLAITHERSTKSNNVEMCCRRQYELINVISTPLIIAVLILTTSVATKNSPQQKEYTSELNWITKLDFLWNEFPQKLIQACEKAKNSGSMLVQEMIKF